MINANKNFFKNSYIPGTGINVYKLSFKDIYIARNKILK